MFSRLREPFGKAGLIVAIVALVTALVGGAYAADHARRHNERAQTGLNAKQKSQVQAIAKSLVGNGPAGPQGPAGATGDTGKEGAKGADATGVTSKALPFGNVHCVAGGTEFHSGAGTTYACNGEEGVEGPPGEDGKEGSPWTDGGTLPPGEAESGSWSVGPFLPVSVSVEGEAATVESFGIANAPLSFTIPLEKTEEEEIHVNYLAEGEGPTAACPGTSADPDAAPGNLCVYMAEGFGATFLLEINPENDAFFSGTGKAGVILRFFLEEPASNAFGNWIVRAPEDES